MIADALNTPPRSLEQYAEELRDRIAFLESKRITAGDGLFQQINSDLRRQLLAVEREINWRMGL